MRLPRFHLKFLVFNQIFESSWAEGTMDIKYLSKRYERRKEWVESFFQTHHRYMETPSGLSDGHSLLAQFQSAGEGQRNPSPLHCCKSEGPRGCMEPRPNGFTRKNIFPLAFSARAISHMKPLADFKIQPRFRKNQAAALFIAECGRPPTYKGCPSCWA